MERRFRAGHEIASKVAAHAAGRTREDGDFCSKGIFQDIRDEFGDRIDAALDADTQQTIQILGIPSLAVGEEQLAEKFREEGSQVYLRADAVENSFQTT